MNSIDWYFDFVSPFAYLASESLARFPDTIEIKPIPILFVGLLKHWQTRGPAEIAPMRRFTYRHIRWLADRAGIALTFPPVHPFNPLKLLRLSIALDNDPAVIKRLFRFAWADGHSSDDARQWQDLIRDLGVDEVDQRIGNPEIKQVLRQNTDAALARGLFGVPGFVVDDEVFWGYDSIDFVIDYLQNPELLRSPGMQAADRVPEGPPRNS